MGKWYEMTARDISVIKVSHKISDDCDEEITEADFVFSDLLFEFFEQYEITTATIIQTKIPYPTTLLFSLPMKKIQAMAIRNISTRSKSSLEEIAVDLFGLSVVVTSDHDKMIMKLAWDGR